MTAEKANRKQNKKIPSIWNKITDVLLVAFISYCLTFLLIFVLTTGGENSISLQDTALNAVPSAVLVALTRISHVYDSDRKILPALRQWRKQRQNYSILVLIVSIIFLCIFSLDFLFIEALPTYSNLIQNLTNFSIVLLPLMAGIHSFTIFIPCGQYLSRLDYSFEERKQMANGLTLTIPTFGLTWLVFISQLFSFLGFEIEPKWILYVGYVLIYAIFFFVFVDLPYSVATNEIKNQMKKELQSERKKILDEQERDENKNQDKLLQRIYNENKLARLDREIEKVNKISVHPYKFLIPIASFFFGIVGVLFTDFIKNLLQFI